MGRLECKSCGRRTTGLRDLCLFCQKPEPAKPSADQLASAEGGTAVLEAAPPLVDRSPEGTPPTEPVHLAPPVEPTHTPEPFEAPVPDEPNAFEPIAPLADPNEAAQVIATSRLLPTPETPAAPEASESTSTAEGTEEQRDTSTVPKALKLVEECPFFPVSPTKFVAMSICTFGVYDMYWFYKNYQRVAQRSEEPMRPFWRAVFAPLWGTDLFKRIGAHLEGEGAQIAWSAQTLGVIYFVFALTWRLPNPWWLISYLAFIPVLPAVKSLSRLHGRMDVVEGPNTRFSGANIVGLVLGGMLATMTVLGAFLPE